MFAVSTLWLLASTMLYVCGARVRRRRPAVRNPFSGETWSWDGCQGAAGAVRTRTPDDQLVELRLRQGEELR